MLLHRIYTKKKDALLYERKELRSNMYYSSAALLSLNLVPKQCLLHTLHFVWKLISNARIAGILLSLSSSESFFEDSHLPKNPTRKIFKDPATHAIDNVIELKYKKKRNAKQWLKPLFTKT